MHEYDTKTTTTHATRSRSTVWCRRCERWLTRAMRRPIDPRRELERLVERLRAGDHR